MPTRLAWLIICLSTGLYAQDRVDSLRNALEDANPLNDPARRARLAATIALEYGRAGAYDSALVYYRISQVSGTSPALQASTYNGMGVCFSRLGLTDSAIVAYTKGLRLYEDLRDTLNSTIIHTNLAILYKDRGLYDKALDHAFYAARAHERSGNRQALASAFNTISLVYLKLQDRDQALSYARKALSLRKAIGYQKGIAQSYTNLGEIWLALNQYDSALASLEQAYQLKNSLGDLHSVASTLNNLGNLYQRQGRYDEALRYYEESLRTKDQSRDLQGLAVTWNNVGRVQVRLSLPEAHASLLRAEQLIRQTGMLEELSDNLRMQADLLRQKSRFADALVVTQELMLVKDSLLNKQKADVMTDLLVKYESEKKEQEIALLRERDRVVQSELTLRKYQVYALLVGLILVAAIAFLVYRNLRLARESRNRISLLLKELHHRVKNNLQLLSSVFGLQSQYLNEPAAILAVRSSESRVNAMALIHKKLYDGTMERSVSLREYVAELVQYLMKAYDFSEQELNVTLDIPPVEVDVDKAIPIGLIVNELVSNSLKYAFPDKAGAAITVAFRMQDDKMELEVRDNGKGLATGPEAKAPQSFGLRMVNLLVRQLKGRYEVDSRSGTAYTLTLPL